MANSKIFLRYTLKKRLSMELHRTPRYVPNPTARRLPLLTRLSLSIASCFKTLIPSDPCEYLYRCVQVFQL